ncbi:unnamed protein product, partial [Arabidopsis halleri]
MSAEATRVLGVDDPDANMEDVGRPPGDGVVDTSTWVEKVQGSIGGGLPVPERVLDDEFVASRMAVEYPDGEDGEPVRMLLVDAAEQENDGFTVVRKAGRRGEAPTRKASFTAGGSGKGHAISGEGIAGISGSKDISISNSFRALNGDCMEEGIKEVMATEGVIKEAAVETNIPNKGKSVGQEKETAIVGKENRVFGENRGGVMEAKNNNGSRVGKSVGFKKAGPRVNKPMRGLVFGPTRGEHVVSSSGKRLRIESDNVGRGGGVFTVE